MRGDDPDFSAATNEAARLARQSLVRPEYVPPPKPLRRPEPPRVERPAVEARPRNLPQGVGTLRTDITVERIRAMLDTGLSPTKIARELKCNATTVYGRLKAAGARKVKGEK